MEKYYSKEKLLNSMYDMIVDEGMVVTVLDKEDLESVPTADVAPAVHAHWIEEEDCMAVTDMPWSMCSVCGSYSLKLPYCAFCGAKMDEVI